MVNQALVTLVNSVLGQGKPTARNNYAYHCPFCHHHKPKLEVNLTENDKGKNSWHCWTCDEKGTSIYSLFKKIKVDRSKIESLKSIIKTSQNFDSEIVEKSLELPVEFSRIPDNPSDSDIVAKHALNYLKSRKIHKPDIIKYNIGYASKGKYKNRIIIPTYDKNGNLNYFTARNFIGKSSLNYLNPSTSRNIIANEHLINWDLPIILCEGLFDAIAIKRNVIPLLGKNIQSNLMKKLISSKVDKIYIALDKDAIKQSLKFCETLMNSGKEVYLVDLKEKDPSEMGFKEFTKLIQNTTPLTYYGLLEKKLSL